MGTVDRGRHELAHRLRRRKEERRLDISPLDVREALAKELCAVLAAEAERLARPLAVVDERPQL
jgi:hypothetical protein